MFINALKSFGISKEAKESIEKKATTDLYNYIESRIELNASRGFDYVRIEEKEVAGFKDDNVLNPYTLLCGKSLVNVGWDLNANITIKPYLESFGYNVEVTTRGGNFNAIVISWSNEE